jgi:putative glycosyltransferase
MDRVIGQWFYDLHRAVTGMTLPENVTTARLMTRRFVEALAQHDDRELYLEGLFQLTGFVQRPVAVTKHHTSRTTYTMSRKIAIVVDSVTATSGRPFAFMVLVGGAAISGALLYLVVTAGRMADEANATWTFLLGSVWLLGGAIILCLGILGTYLWKTLLEAKRRPRALVRRVYGRDTD